MARLQAPSADQWVKVLILGAVFLVLITQVINFSALQSDDPDVKIFKEDVNYETLAPDIFKYIIIGAATWLAWIVATRYAGARWDKKAIISLALTAIVLYLLYTKVLQPMLGLEELSFAAYQLQALIAP